MTGTNCDLFTHKSCPSYLNHLAAEVQKCLIICSLSCACQSTNCVVLSFMLLAQFIKIQMQDEERLKFYKLY